MKRNRGDEDVGKETVRDAEEEPSAPPAFQAANSAAMGGRKIALARRTLKSASATEDGAPQHTRAFAGFTGFQKPTGLAPPTFGVPANGRETGGDPLAPKGATGFSGFGLQAPKVSASTSVGFKGFDVTPRPAPQPGAPAAGGQTADGPTGSFAPTNDTVQGHVPVAAPSQPGQFRFGVPAQDAKAAREPQAISKPTPTHASTFVFGVSRGEKMADTPVAAESCGTANVGDSSQNTPQQAVDASPAATTVATTSIVPPTERKSTGKPRNGLPRMKDVAADKVGATPQSSLGGSSDGNAATMSGPNFTSEPANKWMATYTDRMAVLNRDYLAWVQQWVSQYHYVDLTPGMEVYMEHQKSIVEDVRKEVSKTFSSPGSKPAALAAPADGTQSPDNATAKAQTSPAMGHVDTAADKALQQDDTSDAGRFSSGQGDTTMEQTTPMPFGAANSTTSGAAPTQPQAAALSQRFVFGRGPVFGGATHTEGVNKEACQPVFGAATQAGEVIKEASQPIFGVTQQTNSEAKPFALGKETEASNTATAPTTSPSGGGSPPPFVFGRSLAAKTVEADTPKFQGFSFMKQAMAPPPSKASGPEEAAASGSVLGANRFASLAQEEEACTEEAGANGDEDDEGRQEVVPDKRDVVGEDDEENIVSTRSKLYEFKKNGQGFLWKEMGLGDLRINKYVRGENAGRYRILLRPDSAAGRIVLNAMVDPIFKPTKQSRNSLIISVVFAGDSGEPEVKRILIKVKSPEELAKVDAALSEGLKVLK